MSGFPGPDEIYGALFEAVQRNHVFADSKTFVDAVPSAPVALILDRFAALPEPHDRSTLMQFVEGHFEVPTTPTPSPLEPQIEIGTRVEQLWDVLSRTADRAQPGSSLLELPRPYVVPGGRFREIYYWDSYFTMLGLAASGRIDAIEDMVKNFAYLIDRVGFIPNGNRTYFCTRSQPPFFLLMIELLADCRTEPQYLQRYLGHIEREYAFWMRGSSDLADGQAAGRVVRIGDALLNRYWDAAALPRPESYAEDIAVAATTSDRDPGGLFRDLRAGCESGWDFSSRWLEDAQDLASIRCTAILPVDLNCLLYRVERALADGHQTAGEHGRAERYAARAAARRRLLRTLFFDSTTGLFGDVLLATGQRTASRTLATAYPLFCEVATSAQAARVAARLQADFLAEGGWRTTLTASGQQWDLPNGWAPLQWVAFQGLQAYGFTAAADEGARRWLRNCQAVYDATGRLLEKYDVEQVGALAAGGEYAVQDGFGWTNGVFLALTSALANRQT